MSGVSRSSPNRYRSAPWYLWIGGALGAGFIALAIFLMPKLGATTFIALPVTGTWMAWTLSFKTTVYALHLFGLAVPGFAALYALIANIVVAVVLSLVAAALSSGHTDAGMHADYA
jgi:uncharacterized membrane protein YdcZ (DUF606 family)